MPIPRLPDLTGAQVEVLAAAARGDLLRGTSPPHRYRIRLMTGAVTPTARALERRQLLDVAGRERSGRWNDPVKPSVDGYAVLRAAGRTPDNDWRGPEAAS